MRPLFGVQDVLVKESIVEVSASKVPVVLSIRSQLRESFRVSYDRESS